MKRSNFMAIIAFGAVLSACVNLKSELPSISYYALESAAVESAQCEAFELIALGGIEVPKEYQNQVLYREGGQIRAFDSVRFIRNIDKSFEHLLIKRFHANCLKIIVPPISGLNVEKILRVKILDFEIVKGGDFMQDSTNNSANAAESVRDSVESTNDSALDSTESTRDSAPSTRDSTKDSARAIVHILYQITQNGQILQSGIIATDSALDNFNATNALQALQRASLESVDILIHTIIPK